MVKILIALTVFASLTAFAGTPATTTKKVSGKAQHAEPFKLIHVKDLAPLIEAKTPDLYVYDANTPEIRKKEGLIPGAKPLSSVSAYDAAKELPQNKNAHLVFYCANEQCMASHDAAKRAVDAGFQNVSVMADGIQGWVKSGQTTTQIK